MPHQPEKILAGNRRALARLITGIENSQPDALDALNSLYPHTGKAHLIGVTGAPGTGKSSLVNGIAKAYRAKDLTVAILAVDPTSPFSGGAILGDRIRMRDLSGDPGIFIRSMASRGNLGGLAVTTYDVIKALDAAGFARIIIETVGAGQSEVEIARAAHSVLVVEAPGLGDDIQAIKAGILEIADIFVVNKADRPGANKTVTALKNMLDLGHPVNRVMHHGQLMAVPHPTPAESETVDGWQIPVLKTTAIKHQGIDTLVETIEAHREQLATSGMLAQRNRARLAEELETQLRQALMRHFIAMVPPEVVSHTIDKLVKRDISPYNAAKELRLTYSSSN